MVKQITAERAIEAIKICSMFMTPTAYQTIKFPQSVKITGTSVITGYDLKELTKKGFNVIISTSDISIGQIQIDIYDNQ